MINYENFKKTIKGHDLDETYMDVFDIFGYIGKRFFYNIKVMLTSEELEKEGDEFYEILNKKAYEEFKKCLK